MRLLPRFGLLPALLLTGFAQHLLRAADQDDGALPLPSWSQDPSPVTLGGSLFPKGSFDFADGPEGPLLQAPPAVTGPLPVASAADLSLFLPDALLGKTIHSAAPATPVPSGSLRQLDDTFLTVSRNAGDDEYLIDPDTHVPETQREDLIRFLSFHAHDARIKEHIIVADRDQYLPADATLETIVSSTLAARECCVAVIPLGEPARTRLLVSATVRASTTPDYLANVAEDCARDAAQVSDPVEQLHRFAVRLSIRLFWLERMMGSSKTAVTTAAGKDVPGEFIDHREAALNSALQASFAPKGHHAVWRWAQVLLGIVLALAAGAVTFVALRYRDKRLRALVWMLPEIDMPARLGGAFTGGGGHVIQYR